MGREGPSVLRSGLLLFTSRLLSVGTGLLFTLMITRTTTKEQYGIWVNVNADIITYFTLLATALPFWVMRFVSRRHEGSAKTGLIANLILGFISTFLYLPLVSFILSALNVSSDYLPLYLLASVQIIEVYLLAVLSDVLRVVRIEALGYGLLIEESAKVIAAYLLIFRFKLGLLGAMSALVAAYSIQVLYFLYVSRGSLKGRVHWDYFKEWFKGSLTNVYNIIGDRISSFGLILLFTIGGEAARAYYGASFQIAGVIGHSSLLAFALYPKLLVYRRTEDIVTAFKSFFMFAIPMTVGAVILSDSYLTILDIKYRVASPILQMLAFFVFISGLSQILDSIVFGTEKIDSEAKIPLRELVKTKLFMIFSFPYARSLIVLPSLYIVLTIVRNDPLAAALYTVMIMLFAGIILLISRILFVKNLFSFSFPWLNVVKYLFASAVMGVLLLAIPHPTKLSTTLGYTLIGGIVYLLTLMILDRDTRTIVRSIVEEAKKTLKFT